MARHKTSRRANLPAAVQRRADSTKGCHLIKTSFRVITPVHGGGVTGGTGHDPLTPVRGASIRGQLRFWWRATHAHQFDNLNDLRAAEADLWGGAADQGRAGRVSHSITSAALTITSVNNPTFAVKYLARAYVNQDDKLQQFSGKVEMRFLIHGSESDKNQVELALRAWQSFGGIGGRTRRGFGAVSGTHSVEPTALYAMLGQPLTGASVADLSLIPTLHGATPLIGNQMNQDPLNAWRCGARAYHQFRQGFGFARDGTGPRDAHRTRWPETEQIRDLHGLSGHPHCEKNVNVQAFPRAVFGMPIEFTFHGDAGNRFTRAGRDQTGMAKSTLTPVGRLRMASPLILRPVKVDGRWRAVAVYLNVPGLWPGLPGQGVLGDLELQWTVDEAGFRNDQVSSATAGLAAMTAPADMARIPPLRDSGRACHPVIAFMNYFRSNA